MTPGEIEKAAMHSADMPDSLNSPEQTLFQRFRNLYYAYKSGIINREQGSSEKQKILRQYESDMFWYKIYKQHIDIYHIAHTFSLEIEKSDCEMCKRLVRLLDGRELARNGTIQEV